MSNAETGEQGTEGTASLEALVENLRASQLGPATRDGIGQLVSQLGQVKAATQAGAEAVSENTRAILDNTVAQANEGGHSAISEAGKSALSVFTSGFGLSPLLSGLTRLFGGGQTAETPPPLATYTKPEPVHIESSVRSTTEANSNSPATAGGRAPASAAAAPQVMIQVQAMDARSFLDRSDDIARAVRLAMLNSHSINDVVNDL